MSIRLLGERYAVDKCKHKWHMGSKFVRLLVRIMASLLRYTDQQKITK